MHREAAVIGVDLGDRWSQIYSLCAADGKKLEEWKVRTGREAFKDAFCELERARIVIEVGTHSPWVSRLLAAMGHEVIVANPRRVRLIAQGDRKSDRVDAETLARLGRIDPGLLSPIQHRGAAVQKDLALLRMRDGLVRARALVIQQARGLAKSFGERLPDSSTHGFANRVRQAGYGELFPGMPVLCRYCSRRWIS
jgi:transposase